MNVLVTGYDVLMHQTKSICRIEATEWKAVKGVTKVTKWAVRDGSFCLSNVTFEFSPEPVPSSRTKTFLKEFRFNTPKEALEALNKCESLRDS